jgi:chaperonin cofactor prefoldin
LDDFHGLIAKQVDDFHHAHVQVTEGRQQLHAAIESGEATVKEVAKLFRDALYQERGVQDQLAASMHTVGGGISQQLETLETSLKAVEAGSRRLQDKLDRLIGIASGEPLRNARDSEGNGA